MWQSVATTPSQTDHFVVESMKQDTTRRTDKKTCATSNARTDDRHKTGGDEFLVYEKVVKIYHELTDYGL